MDIHSTNNLAFTSGPGLDQVANSLPPAKDELTSIDRVSSISDLDRTRGSRLAEIGVSSKIEGAPKDRLKGLNIIESGWNVTQKFLRSICLAGGWASASVAVVSLLFLNIKILGFIFGVPAALFLYTASTLGRDIKSDPMSGIVKDPLTSLKKILEHHPEILRNDPKFVIRTIQSIDDMKQNTPRYYEVLDRLEALRETILMEKAQVFNKEDQPSLLYKELMYNYLDEIAKVTAAKDKSDAVAA